MKHSMLRRLVELRGNAAFERAEFGHLFGRDDDPLPVTEGEVTTFIRRRTARYLETHVLPFVDELIARERAKRLARKRRKEPA